MSDKLDVIVTRDASGCVLQVWLREPELAGKTARLLITQRAKVKRSNPVHHERVLLDHSLVLANGQNRVVIGAVLDDAFAYVGGELDLELDGTLTVDDGVLFDTRVKVDLSRACRLSPRRKGSASAKSIHSPADRFSLLANLDAIPVAARAKVLGLLIVAVPLVLGNMLLGTRDQLVPESRTWFYDHSGSDGDSESPLVKALIGSGALGIAVWAMVLAQLRRYMTFTAATPEGTVTRETRWSPAAFVSGSARVPLQQCTVRVVAYNREHGQYKKTEKHGNSNRTVTRGFSTDAMGLVLYERMLPHVPAHVDLNTCLDGEVDLSGVFDSLYPPTMLGDAHGVSVQFEVQLLHPDYVDQEVILAQVTLDRAAFFPG